MIDFHSHIIPNIDDGSRSVEETFNLIKEAEKVGFNKIISTSHYMEDYYETDSKERKVWIEALNGKIKEQNINMQLYLGSEIYITENLIDLLEQGQASTINNTSYVLFEFPLNAKPLNILEIISNMIRNKLVPVLAHPERYIFVHKNPDAIYDLIEEGVLMQCNFGSFIGQYGKTAQHIAKEMLLNDMVHLLGSDVHRQDTIYPKIPEIISELKRMVGEEKVKELTEINPELVLNNKRIEITDPIHLKVSFTDKIKNKILNI